MKEIELTRGLKTLVDDEDYDFLNQWKWTTIQPNRVYYAHRKNYNKETQKSTNIYMHRLIMQVTNSKEHIDHIDGNGLNNQKSNLRIANNSQNLMNVGKKKNNTSGYKGVVYRKEKKKWCAQIRINYKRIFLGYFIHKEDAAKAYNEAAYKYFGEYAKLNDIEKN